MAACSRPRRSPPAAVTPLLGHAADVSTSRAGSRAHDRDDARRGGRQRRPTPRRAVTLADALLRQTRVSGNAGLAMRGRARAARRARTRRRTVRRAPHARRRLSRRSIASPTRFARHERCQTMRADDAWVYGVIGDAHIERGEYDAAFDAFDRMAAIKPTAAAYARVSYARELQGDLPGALRTMQMAAEATSAHDPGVARVASRAARPAVSGDGTSSRTRGASSPRRPRVPGPSVRGGRPGARRRGQRRHPRRPRHRHGAARDDADAGGPRVRRRPAGGSVSRRGGAAVSARRGRVAQRRARAVAAGALPRRARPASGRGDRASARRRASSATTSSRPTRWPGPTSRPASSIKAKTADRSRAAHRQPRSHHPLSRRRDRPCERATRGRWRRR